MAKSFPPLTDFGESTGLGPVPFRGGGELQRQSKDFFLGEIVFHFHFCPIFFLHGAAKFSLAFYPLHVHFAAELDSRGIYFTRFPNNRPMRTADLGPEN